jgi:hypothetical protein
MIASQSGYAGIEDRRLNIEDLWMTLRFAILFILQSTTFYQCYLRTY